MWQSFVAWGNTYGLWVTIGLLIFILILMKIENGQLRKTVDKLRDENTQLGKLKIINEKDGIKL